MQEALTKLLLLITTFISKFLDAGYEIATLSFFLHPTNSCTEY